MNDETKNIIIISVIIILVLIICILLYIINSNTIKQIINKIIIYIKKSVFNLAIVPNIIAEAEAEEENVNYNTLPWDDDVICKNTTFTPKVFIY